MILYIKKDVICRAAGLLISVYIECHETIHYFTWRTICVQQRAVKDHKADEWSWIGFLLMGKIHCIETCLWMIVNSIRMCVILVSIVYLVGYHFQDRYTFLYTIKMYSIGSYTIQYNAIHVSIDTFCEPLSSFERASSTFKDIDFLKRKQ